VSLALRERHTWNRPRILTSFAIKIEHRIALVANVDGAYSAIEIRCANGGASRIFHFLHLRKILREHCAKHTERAFIPDVPHKTAAGLSLVSEIDCTIHNEN
jgi:nitrite reductase/ring-hydroxylating ferredoxin subunit